MVQFDTRTLQEHECFGVEVQRAQARLLELSHDKRYLKNCLKILFFVLVVLDALTGHYSNVSMPACLGLKLSKYICNRQQYLYHW